VVAAPTSYLRTGKGTTTQLGDPNGWNTLKKMRKRMSETEDQNGNQKGCPPLVGMAKRVCSGEGPRESSYSPNEWKTLRKMRKRMPETEDQNGNQKECPPMVGTAPMV
jgi:hypothetical protein